MSSFKVSRRHLTTRQRSKKSEKDLAKAVGGRVQPASGALPVAGLKGDVISQFCLFDDKTTLGKSFSVTFDVLEKLRLDAFRVRKRPVVRVSFEERQRAVYVLDEAAFKEYMHFLLMRSE